MSVKAGETFAEQFTTHNLTTSAAQNADALPVATFVKDGVDTAEVVTVTNVSTGVYKFSVTVPADYADGARVAVRVAATINGTAVVGTVWASQVGITSLAAAAAVESGVTPIQALRAMCAMLAGVISGANASTGHIKAMGGTKERVTMATDSSGNRITVTLDLSDGSA